MSSAMNDDGESNRVLSDDQASCIALMQKMLDVAEFELAVVVAVTSRGTTIHTMPSMPENELAAILRFFATGLDGLHASPPRVEH